MDIKEYISSGIIESYVLGVVSDQERREVECMSKIYPELHQNLLEAQSRLEDLSESWKKEPPVDLKSRVMAAIREVNQIEVSNAKKEAKVVSLNAETPRKGDQYTKWVAAASVILVLGAASLFFVKNRELNAVENELRAQREMMEAQEVLVAELKKEVNGFNAEQLFITDDNTITVALAGTPNSPESKVKAYWNKEKNEVLLAGVNLPKNDTNQQYQLWAIVDGKPVDLGMLDAENPSQSVSKKVKDSQVQAFAITLEKKGGSPSPNLDQLYVIGNVGS